MRVHIPIHPQGARECRMRRNPAWLLLCPLLLRQTEVLERLCMTTSPTAPIQISVRGEKKLICFINSLTNFFFLFLLFIPNLTRVIAGTLDGVSLTFEKGHSAGLFSILVLHLIWFQSNFF